MTFEGFDTAPLIEATGFSATLAEVPEAETATLDAALRETARAERAAARADATMLDLWLDRAGGANMRALERPGSGAGTSWHAWAALAVDGGGVLDLGGGKDVPLFAAYGDDEEIVVVGSKNPNEVDEDDNGNMGGPGGGFYPGGPEGPGVGEGGGQSLDSEANDPPDVTTEVLNEANRQKVEDAKIEMEKEVARLTPLIQGLADNAVITFKDGSTLTGAELKALWARIDFVVTDREYGPNRAGALVGNVSYINAGAALGWDAHTNGLAFIMIHDLVHMTPEGQAYYLSLWQQHLAAGGTSATWPNSPLFVTNEQFANSGALAIDNALGIPAMTTTPTYGY